MKKGDRKKWIGVVVLVFVVVGVALIVVGHTVLMGRRVDGLEFEGNYRLVVADTSKQKRGQLHLTYDVREGGREVKEFDWEPMNVMVYDGCIGAYGVENTYARPTEMIKEKECKLLAHEWEEMEDGSLEYTVKESNEGPFETTDERFLSLRDELAAKIVEKEGDYVRWAYVFDAGGDEVYVWTMRADVDMEEEKWLRWLSHYIYEWDDDSRELIYVGKVRKDMYLVHVEKWDGS